ncbi:MAG TPA: hypothetical protein VNU19_02335, partial [Candidatus Acidoferrum sp.]|nr:hypothetical protein [Candidatus Acidoferrum sp.]
MAHREKQQSVRAVDVNLDGTREYGTAAVAPVTPMAFTSLETSLPAAKVPLPVVSVDDPEVRVKAVSHV